MDKPDEEWRPRRREGLLTETVDDDVIVLDQSGKLVHQLNTVAAFIFRQCDGERTVAAIVAAVCREFEVDISRAEEDVTATLSKLRTLTLVE